MNMISSLLMIWLAGGFAAGPATPEGLLDKPYFDGTFGFSIQPPREWQIIRERQLQPVGLTVLRLARQVAIGVTLEMSVRVSRTEQPVSIHAALEEMSSALKKTRKGAVVDEPQMRTLTGRKAGFLSASFDLDGQRTVF